MKFVILALETRHIYTEMSRERPLHKRNRRDKVRERVERA
jgi:hypothetical protein